MLTVQEVAAALGIEASVVRRRLIAGAMKGHKINSRLWLISRRELARWQRKGPPRIGRPPGAQNKRQSSETETAA